MTKLTPERWAQMQRGVTNPGVDFIFAADRMRDAVYKLRAALGDHTPGAKPLTRELRDFATEAYAESADVMFAYDRERAALAARGPADCPECLRGGVVEEHAENCPHREDMTGCRATKTLCCVAGPGHFGKHQWSGQPPPEFVGAVGLIASERRRQVEAEGYSAAHDDEHNRGELAVNAARLAVASTDAHVEHPDDEAVNDKWADWGLDRKHADEVRRLVVAGALIVAEIERVQRRDGARAHLPSQEPHAETCGEPCPPENPFGFEGLCRLSAGHDGNHQMETSFSWEASTEPHAEAEGKETTTTPFVAFDRWWCHGTCQRHGSCQYRDATGAPVKGCGERLGGVATEPAREAGRSIRERLRERLNGRGGSFESAAAIAYVYVLADILDEDRASGAKS